MERYGILIWIALAILDAVLFTIAYRSNKRRPCRYSRPLVIRVEQISTEGWTEVDDK